MVVAGDPGELRASLSLLRGTVAASRGRTAEAERSLGEALAWREAHPDARGPTLARIEGGGHNDLWSAHGVEVMTALRRFVAAQ